MLPIGCLIARAVLASVVVVVPLAVVYAAEAAAPSRGHDVVVYAATPAGIAAAVSAAREGCDVLVVEPTRHVGGLLASGLNTIEWNQDWNTFGGVLGEFLAGIDAAYGVTEPGAARQTSWESKVAERVMLDVLDTARRLPGGGRVEIVYDAPVDRVDKTDGRIVSFAAADGRTFRGTVFVDASYEGDVMARAGVTYAVGREPREQYGEPLAGIRLDATPVAARPFDATGDLLPDVTARLDAIGPEGSGDGKVMVYNFRVILEHVGADNPHPVPRPEGYSAARYQMLAGVLAARPDITLEELLYVVPRPGRKVELNNRQDATVSIGLLGGQHEWPEAGHARRRELWQESRNYTLGFLWYLANEPTVPAALRNRMREYALPRDEFTDNDHWPWQIYVREARRMVGRYVLRQRDLTEDRDKPDAIALGSHFIDTHHVQRLAESDTLFRNEGRIWVDLNKEPYEIPYRCLTPQAAECSNLLVPVCLSASHVAFSSVRVEETWMMLGQAAGTAAARAARGNTAVQDVDVPALRRRLAVTGQHVERDVFAALSEAAGPAKPPLEVAAPAAGRFVRRQLPAYKGGGVYHGLYLPRDWKPGDTHPVVVEYAPNQWKNLSGTVDDCRLGFDLTGGERFIWLVLPYVDPVKGENVRQWWGDEQATIAYLEEAVTAECAAWGGDPAAVFFAGFSRGAIAAGYLGLRSDEVAKLWRGFILHSHIDGGRFTPDGAHERLGRTRGRPTFVTYGSDDSGRTESPKGAAILRSFGFPVVERKVAGLTHTDRFLDVDSPIRRELRGWLDAVLAEPVE
jgi:hypothetical protein